MLGAGLAQADPGKAGRKHADRNSLHRIHRIIVLTIGFTMRLTLSAATCTRPMARTVATIGDRDSSHVSRHLGQPVAWAGRRLKDSHLPGLALAPSCPHLFPRHCSN